MSSFRLENLRSWSVLFYQQSYNRIFLSCERNFYIIVTSSAIDIFFEITKFSKILSKFTFISNILSKFDKNFEIFRKKSQFRKYFRKICNFEKSVMVDEGNISSLCIGQANL